MNVQQFIEKAIEGGWVGYWDYVADGDTPETWVNMDCENDIHRILLDPLAWKAVGTVEGWNNLQVPYRHGDNTGLPTWHSLMHRLIDHLAEGGTIESFLETL